MYQCSAVEMIRRMREGETSSVELVRALHARADAVEGAVHAFTARYPEEALTRARAADEARQRGEDWGPLHGLPITVKENLALTGTPATVGIRARRGTLADTHAPVVQAALDAGAIVLGKTNVPQLLLAMETHNDIWGTTFNPWDLRRVPGGSSGGEAAAIASGASPVGIGTDIGGSIRNPAAWCGICGLKPTWGRWSVYGSASGQPGQEAVRAQSGPLARTVADIELMMRALSPERQHALDPLVPPLPLPPVPTEIRGMRIGVYEDDGVFRPGASVRRAVAEAAAALRAAGAEVIPYEPPRSWEMVDTYFGLMSADGTRTARALIGGEDVTPQLRTITRLARLPALARRLAAGLLEGQGEVRVARVLRALGEKRLQEVWALTVQREALKRAEIAAWRKAGISAVVGPATPTPAALLGETHDWSLGAWHTMRWNLLDHPAGVLAVTRVRADEQVRDVVVDRLDRKAATFEAGSVGLPIGVQVIGRPWEEEVVLAVMRGIEAAVSSASPELGRPVDPR